MLCVSSPVEPDALNAGLDALRFAGLDPVTYPSAHDPGTMRRYLAGDDAMRAGDLRSALTDPGIAGILFARGGSGAQRTLEAMDWDGLTGMPPKVLAGYSDVTAVLEAVAVRLGWASVFGPMVAIREGASHYSFGSLLRTLMRPEQATMIEYPRAVTVVPGLARGVTTGGTLCLLASSLATGTSRPARGGILLLEDVNEEDYRVDRMLTQLRRSGYLDGVAGIVAGTFTGCGPPEAIQDILAERLGSLDVPMIAWANVGHGGLFQAFPYGIAAELDAGAATLRLLDPPRSAEVCLHPQGQPGVHPARPQRAAVDEPGVGLDQRGAGPQPLPGVVRGLDPAGRDEHQPVPGPGVQPAQHLQRTGPQRRARQAARPGRRHLGRRAGQPVPGHGGVGRDDPVEAELERQVRDRVHVRVGQVRRDLDQQRHAAGPRERRVERGAHRHQHRPEPVHGLQVAQARRVRRADVDHHVVGHGGHRPRAAPRSPRPPRRPARRGSCRCSPRRPGRRGHARPRAAQPAAAAAARRC